jgi:hypothetical protein
MDPLADSVEETSNWKAMDGHDVHDAAGALFGRITSREEPAAIWWWSGADLSPKLFRSIGLLYVHLLVYRRQLPTATIRGERR